MKHENLWVAIRELKALITSGRNNKEDYDKGIFIICHIFCKLSALLLVAYQVAF